MRLSSFLHRRNLLRQSVWFLFKSNVCILLLLLPFVNVIKTFFSLNKYGYVMLSPSFSSFFPLKRQNMPIFFQAVVFSLNCKIRFYISQFEIFFLFFYPSSPLDLPHSSFCIKHLLQNSSEPRFSPRSPPLAIFISPPQIRVVFRS